MHALHARAFLSDGADQRDREPHRPVVVKLGDPISPRPAVGAPTPVQAHPHRPLRDRAALLAVSWYWSREPKAFWVNESPSPGVRVAGFATVDTLIRVTSTLLDKPGALPQQRQDAARRPARQHPELGYGVLVQVRDLVGVLRNDYSRSQSQSIEDSDLAAAAPLPNSATTIPGSCRAAKASIGKRSTHLENYRTRLTRSARKNAQFYARADNLREWLAVVEKRPGSLTQRLTASVGQTRVNVDLAGERAAERAPPVEPDIMVKTSWLQLDDNSRGPRLGLALIHFMRAAEFDFQDVLRDKNATVSLRQIIRELEASQQPLHSPIIMNGRGFGLFPNHSLVMATYLARANSAVINLRELLSQG